MAETTQLDSPVLTLPVTEEAIRAGESLRRLRERKLEINSEIRALLEDKDLIPRLPAQCLRCGYTWYPYDPFVPPITCARCGTTAWHLPPTATSRKPSDVPSPSWRRRKGKRTQKRGDTISRYRVAQKRRPGRSTVLVGGDRDSIIPPWERAHPEAASTRGWTQLFTIGDTLPPPPAISSPLPPPPAITPSLSERFARLRGPEEMEPQPEVVASHVEPTLDDRAPEITMDEVISTPEKIADELSTLDIPPEQVGVPRDSAEKEELEKARAESWPTTQPE